MFIIYVIDLSTKNKNVRGFIFSQKSKIQTVGNGKKKFFFTYFISEIPGKRVHFLRKIQAKNTLFCIFVFSVFIQLFLKTTPNGFWRLSYKIFFISSQNNLFSFFLFSVLSDYFWFCVSFKFVYFSHVKAVLSVYLKCFKNASAWFKMILRRWFNYLSYNFILLITVEMHQNKKFFLI